MKKISVIMSTYKEPIEWIKKSVDSILNQTFSDFEFIIIVDDPKYNELISLLNVYREKDSRIRVIVNEHNIGLVRSLNKALSNCSGQYIARMDADDISLPDRLLHQIRYLEKNSYDLIGCFYKVFYEDKVIRIAKGARTSQTCSQILQYESCSAHPAWLARKKVFDNLRGYRDFDACEDYDFLIRASLAGYKIGNVPEILLEYRDNPNSISHGKSGIQYSITQLLSENYRMGKMTSIDEYQSYLNTLKHNKIAKDYEKIATIDRKRHLSNNKIYKIFYFSRLISFREFRKMKIRRRKINRWKQRCVNE